MASRNGKATLSLAGFGGGAGAFRHSPGRYAVATGADCRWGYAMPGLREVADRTGIAAGFREIKAVRHNDVMMLATTNSTDTRVYRLEAGVWAQKVAIVGAVATDLVSFNNVVAVALGASTAYQFSSDNGTTWTASTKAGSGKFANYATVQQNGLITPRVTYCVNPNLLFYTTDLTNAGTSTTSSVVGDNQATADYFTSLTEDDTGVLLIGKRRALYSINSEGLVIKLTRDYHDPPADAGGQSDRNNFESYARVEGRVAYIVQGYELVEYDHGDVNEYLAPKWYGLQIPRMQLPLNAITSAGNWYVLAMGSKNPSTLMNVANAPGGTALLQNTFTTTSEIWVGRRELDEQGQLTFTWHGALLLCSKALRYLWWDEDDGYLYMASGDSETVNNQQVRAYFLTAPPLTHQVGGIVNLNTGTWTVETGLIDFDSHDAKLLRKLEAETVGLAATVPSLEARYRPQSDYDNAAYTSLATWTNNFFPERGIYFPPYQSFRTCRLQFVGTGDAVGNTYAILLAARLTVEGYHTW